MLLVPMGDIYLAYLVVLQVKDEWEELKHLLRKQVVA